jgi:hypothetical protein
MRPGRNSPGYLEVKYGDRRFDQFISGDEFTKEEFDPLRRIFDSELLQPTGEPIKMLLHEEGGAAIDRDHLIDSVTEDEAAILHREHSLPSRKVRTI